MTRYYVISGVDTKLGSKNVNDWRTIEEWAEMNNSVNEKRSECIVGGEAET